MKKLTISKGQQEYNLYIENVKIIIGENYFEKFEIMRIIRSTFNFANSEYSNNREAVCKLFVNEKELNIKKSILFDISPSFDLNTDLKMGSKSLTLKFFDKHINEGLYFDSISTINLLFKSLEEEINKFQEDLNIYFEDFSKKIMLKLISAALKIDDEQANMYDLDYESYILVLIKMISYISRKSLYEESIVILDIPVITSKIYMELQKIRDCFILVFTRDSKCKLVNDDIFLCSKYLLDFADDEEVYEVLCEKFQISHDLKEIKQMLNRYINQKDENTELIKSILE